MMLKEFPFSVRFFDKIEDRWEGEKEIDIFTSICDVQLTTKEQGIFAQEADYAIYIPLKKGESGDVIPIGIYKNHNCDVDMYGDKFTAVVIVPAPVSQFGKQCIYIKRKTWENTD